MQPSRIVFAPPTLDQLHELQGWWRDAAAVAAWAGPRFRFPFDDRSFLEDLRLDEVASLAACDASGELVAFGQIYERYGRVHLARLAVSPGWRSRGVGGRLVRELIDLGRREIGVAEASLYVLRTNLAARRCYEREGFVARVPPAEDPIRVEEGIQDALFMVRP